MNRIRLIYTYISSIRLIPHLFLYKFSSHQKIISQDIDRWVECLHITIPSHMQYLYLMTNFKEYRNLFYYRIGIAAILIKWLCPPMSTLFISTEDIGAGLFIPHGFATIIAAKSIGKNCKIYQQVTIGYNYKDAPVIGDNVNIYPGAVVVGAVIIGDNSKISAGATVVNKNIPANAVVTPAKAVIVRLNGEKINQML